MSILTKDILWKVMLEEVFDDLLLFLFPDIMTSARLDGGFEFLDKELVEMYPEPYKEGHTGFVDKLVKAYGGGDKEEWMLFHIEIQGYHDSGFAERMYKYHYRIWDKYKSPLISLVIFTGRDTERMPSKFEYKCGGTRMVFYYNCLSIFDFTDEELEVSDNAFAMVLRIARECGKKDDAKLLRGKLNIAQSIKEKDFGRKKEAALLSFLVNYGVFKDRRNLVTLMEGLNKIAGRKNTMGILEYLRELKIEEVRAEVRIEMRTEKDLVFVKSLLAATDWTNRKIADITGTSRGFVKRVRAGKC